MLWLLAAASLLGAPERVKDRSWWSPQDVPTHMLEDEITYYVGYALIVDPQGKVRECRIEESSGLPKLDSYTCKLASGRARLTPARDAQGKAVFGAYRELTSFWMGDHYPRRRDKWGDLEITVPADRIPDGKVKHVKLALSVDQAGMPTDCAPTKHEPEVQIAQLACPPAMASLRLLPVYDDRRTYVPSVQNVTISVSPR